MIVPIRLDRLAAAGVAAEIDAVSELVQQHALELAQRHVSGPRAQAGERVAVGVVQPLVTVFLAAAGAAAVR